MDQNTACGLIHPQPKPGPHFRAGYNDILVVRQKSSDGEFPRPDLISNPNHDLRELERCESLGHNNPHNIELCSSG